MDRLMDRVIFLVGSDVVNCKNYFNHVQKCASEYLIQLVLVLSKLFRGYIRIKH